MTTKSKVTLAIIAIVLVGTAAVWYASKSDHAHAESGDATPKTQYTCGMHPQVIQDKPGNCPICGMKLTRMKRDTGATGERKIKYWRAPMDPTYISEKPGKSPMGMDLVPVYEDGSDAANDSTISIDPVTIQNMGIRTAILAKGPLRRVIRTVGTIDYDESATADVTTKFKGWIEKLWRS